MDKEEKQEWVYYHKLIGNKYFRSKNYEKATEIYMQTLTAAKILEDKNTVVIVLCNLASCMINQNQFNSAIYLTQQALNIQPENPRAYERRAQAFSSVGNIQEAENSLHTGLKYSSDNKSLETKMKKMLSDLHKDKAKSKEIYKKMIENKSKLDVFIPKWLVKVTKIALYPFSAFSNLTSMCKRKST